MTCSRVGKTRLVQTTRDRIKFYGGYYVERKFDETSTQSCLSLVLSAFDDMLVQIAQSEQMEHRHFIYLNLIQEFGPNFQFLAQMLPNVLLFSPSTTNYPSSHRMESTVNIISLCFTIQRFMKVISLSTSPGMIFLDDLQVSSCWCFRVSCLSSCSPNTVSVNYSSFNSVGW